MIRLYFVVIIFSLLLSSACKTDFDINADYKDITIIYCLLNQKDTVHYARINRAFLGEGNALILAQDPQNSLYPYEDIEVTMEEWLNENLQTTYTLDTVILNDKEPGVFSSPSHVLYSFTAHLNENATYKIIVRNTKLGKIIEGETKIVTDFKLEKPYMPPVPPPPQVYVHPFISFIGTSPIILEWLSAKNGKRYQVLMRYYYSVTDLLESTTDTISIDWNLGTLKSPDTGGNEIMKTEINKEGFYIMLKDNIDYNPQVKRKSLYLDFIFSVAGEEFNTYMEVNEPSSSLIQEKPLYTNISNGIGLFNSRFIKDELSAADQRPMRFQLNPQSISELINGQHTNKLGFINPDTN
ncbi:MAG: hypothetical protein PHT69_10610 [Bacteroidales bacterium]|nr:hypothetical protein [Bacteroidales bacterium]